ncbi:deleted in lung and esophageal cancer protein 1 isoform X21 [Vulpes vulpes]|uniref:Deleted in lung and esophageal cancer protein 1 isoform X21 n=1 Tax=Vulpes vulpes TaxID=9627 RepID=A0ABM4XX01_VULVU
METGGAEAPQSGESGSCALGGATWTPTSPVARVRSPSESARLPSLAYSEAFHYGFGSRARRVGPPTLQPLPEPHLLRLRPTSLRTQDISHLLTGVFRNLYTNEVVGEDLSASLIKARGSEDARHEEFVDELQRIREVYKQRLDEVEMLERHIIQARARALAEKERIMQQAKVHVLENFITVPPVKSIFRWCVDSELLQKHHLISPDDYYSDTVPFCSAPKGVSIPGYSKLTFSCEKHSVPKKHLTKKLKASSEEMLTKVKDELNYTVDSRTGDLSLKGKRKTVKAGPSKNAKWMSHLHVPQRELERLLLVRMESRNRFLKNPRFFPPNTPHGGKSLLFPPKKPVLTGDFPSGDLEESCVDTPVFLAKPSIGFFTDYEIGPVYEAVATIGFVEQPPFGILPSVFELAPGQAICMEVLFLPTSLEKAEQTFIVVCDNCQIKELVTVGIGQLVALDLIYISGEESHPEPGELTDLTAQHFIRFEPENLQSTAGKQLIIRNATHVELAFHWQIMKPNLQSLMPGETYSLDSLKYHPDRETAFSILPERGVLGPHTDHEFILTFSPHELRDFHSVLQMVLEEVPEPLSLELENLKDSSFSVDDVIVLEIEVKGSVEPFQLLLEPYALIIPGENYVGINVKKDFKMWNNSKSPIRYLWGKISDCHIIEVEPCAGTIEPNEVEDFELSFTGGVPGPVSQDLLCEIQNSPSPVVLHIEAAFKGPALVISVSALQFGLLRLGQKATNSIQIQNISQLPATWCMKESPVYLQERHEDVSPFDIEPSSGQIHPLGECRVNITLEAKQCQRLQTVLELEVVNGTWSYLPVYAEVQEPFVYLQNSHVEVRNLYLGVPAKATITLINGTLLPTRFHWSKLLGHQASVCTAKVSPRRGTLGPSEERQLNLELTAHTEEELSDLALPCTVSGMKEPLVLGISGKPQGLQVAIAISMEGSDSSVPSIALWPGHLEELHLDFGSKVPLRTRMNCQLILTNHSPIQTPFTLKFEYFGSPQNSLNQKPSLFYGKHVVTWERSCLLSPHFPGHTGGPPTAEHRHHRLCQHVGRVLGQPHLHDIRLDWETYTPEDREDRLLELLVFYGPPFPLRDQAGNDLSCPETPESSSSFWSSSPSNTSDSSHEAAQSAEGSDRASQKIISVVLREHDGVPADHLYCISPKQVVVPMGGSSTISISYTPMVLGPEVLHKVECVGYALGFMSLDDEAERELPGRRHRLQDFAAGPLRLDLCGYVRPAQLSMELDYGGGVEFRHQASDLIPEQPCTGVLSELMTTHHLKLTNTTEIPQYFQLLVSRPFSVSQEGASRSRRAPGPGREQGCEEDPAKASKQLVLHPQENMLVNVSFSLSLELLSYQKLPADQMLPGVDIRQHASGEKEMVFTQSLLLEYANHTTQVVPLRATVAVPELQLSTSWVDFGTCFVNQERVREVYLMNLSGCRSYWAVLMAFRVSPNSGLLEARLVNAPPNIITLQVFFIARSSELYESTLVVEGMLGEKACTLRLRGQGSYDERYMSLHQL